MLRFIAFVWNAGDESQARRAAQMCERTREDGELESVLSVSGAAVFACGFRPGSIECYTLDGDAGVVLGTLFVRRNSGVSVRVEHSAGIGRAVATPQDLIACVWGRYVAFLRRPGDAGAWVMPDPTAGLSVYRATIDGVVVYFAELADCIRFTRAKFQVDWEYIAAHAAMPIHQARETALIGVEELLGGECDEIVEGRQRTHVCWQLSTYAAPRLEDLRDAALCLRQTVKECLHAWASLYSNILLQYSGGVDSSIVLACLRDAPSVPEISCVTNFAVGPGVDERDYARIGVAAASCRWIEQRLDELASFETFRQISPSPRPRIYLSTLYERQLVSAAQQIGAGVIVSGNGGDAEFFEVADVRIASDYVHDHGLGKDFWDVIRSTAALTKTARGRVLRHALTALLKAPPSYNPLAQSQQFQLMLTESTRSAALASPHRYTRLQTMGKSGLPACKAMHIRLMSQPMTVRPPLAVSVDPEYGHWLASQPVLELCAAIPTYVLTQGGRTRSVARAAFADDVPGPLLARRSKGNPAWLIKGLIKNNRSFASSHLRDGRLVAAGVLDGDMVQKATEGTAANVDPWELVCHVSTEVWLERIHEIHEARAP